mmetsp:Transcript_10810/g.22773  ORF Transcript_10810/g.22773 Transcript_10810/m.22773 type:complete len:282 (-) Transcript_10810:18-863(-)
MAATHYASCHSVSSNLDINYQQPLTLLGTIFKDKDGYAKKDCSFTLKQMKGDKKSHANVGKVKLNLAEYVSYETRELMLELRLRNKKNNPIGMLTITLVARHLSDYSRDTGTMASGLSELSVDSHDASDTSVFTHHDEPVPDEHGDEGPSVPSHHLAGVPFTTDDLDSPEPADGADEIERLRFENEHLKREVASLTDRLERRKNACGDLARSMTSYEVELLKTAERQVRIEAEVEERLTAAFVPVIQELEQQLERTKARLHQYEGGGEGEGKQWKLWPFKR